MKKYLKLEATETDNKIEITTDGYGFNPLEMLGVYVLKILDIQEQLNRPANFKRYKVMDDGTRIEITDEEGK